jgi:hypothetical protein
VASQTKDIHKLKMALSREPSAADSTKIGQVVVGLVARQASPKNIRLRPSTGFCR